MRCPVFVDHYSVLCLERESSNLLAIEGYDVTEEVSKFVKALCNENKAFKKVWQDNPIGTGISVKENKLIHSKPKSNDLIIEAVEYYILRSLSLHLGSYFVNNETVSEEYLVKLERNQIPDVLLANRYLDLFSRPMEEREHFIEHGNSSPCGKVVYAFGKDGAIFEHFEMILPRGSSIVKEKDSSISIITSRFKLNYRPEFSGMNTNLPRHFESLYLAKSLRSVSTFDLALYVSIEFYASALLTAKGWGYYWWLDSFLDRLENSFSKEAFLEGVLNFV